MTTHITQSLVKTMRSYKAGEECGYLVHAQFVNDRKDLLSSPSMEQGRYFEFEVSGSTGKATEAPKPEYMKSAKGIADSDMVVEYRRAKFNAKKVKEMLAKAGIKIMAVNQTLTHGRFRGDLDIVAILEKEFSGLPVGTIITIDLKYSGLIYDKWSKHGWEWSEIQKQYHGTQAIHYTLLRNNPFFFLVVGSSNKEKDGVKMDFEPTDMKMFRITVDQHMIDRYIIEANNLWDYFQVSAALAWVPRPEFYKCSKCPLFASCADRHEVPQPVIIDLS